jgi:hypothetical protein
MVFAGLNELLCASNKVEDKKINPKKNKALINATFYGNSETIFVRNIMISAIRLSFLTSKLINAFDDLPVRVAIYVWKIGNMIEQKPRS